MSIAATLPAGSLTVNPYPGLPPFPERDADRFFGRDEEIEQLLRLMASNRFVSVLGVSGCGKSSLVRAGIIPLLRMGIGDRLAGTWRIVVLTPGGAPLANLRGQLNLTDGWPQTSFGLVEFAALSLQANEKLLVFVDQFEELITFRENARDGGNEAALFVNLLLNAVDQRKAPVYVVLSMRSDYLGQAAQFRGLPEAMNSGHYLVPRMTRRQQQEAIERPLEGSGVAMHPALVQRLLNDSADRPDQLPILQHLLKRLWEKRSAADAIGLDDYEAVGGWSDALGREAEEVLAKLPRTVDEPAVRRLFQWITDKGTGLQPVRRPARYSQLAEAAGLEPERLQAVVSAFRERDLLRDWGRALTGDSLIDLPHESVAWQWSRLKRWIEEDADAVARLRFISESAGQGVPLTGSALREAIELGRRLKRFPVWRDRHLGDAAAAASVEAWIDSSQRKERWQRWRLWLSLGAVLVAILVVAILFISQARGQNRKSVARELAAWSAASLNDDPERSLILGLYSWGIHRAMVPGLADRLHDAVLSSLARKTLRGHHGPVHGVAWSPDGGRLATGGDDAAKVWDAAGGRELLTLSANQGIVQSVAWSPDGSRLATASRNKTAKVWDAATGRELFKVEHRDIVYEVKWSRDGSRMATASKDGTAKVWDAASGSELLTIRGHHQRVWSIDWSPDGRYLATASSDSTAMVWEVASGRMLLTLRGHGESIDSVAWSPDGRRIATGSADHTATVWDAKSGGKLLALRGHSDTVESVAWSPNGDRLATASIDGTAKVWDWQSGGELMTLKGHQAAVYSISWSPDGSRLATAGRDQSVKIWEAGGARELQILRGHEDSVWGVAWSPEGRRLATASADHTVKLWDWLSGRELTTLSGHNDRVRGVAWSPEGSRLATASDDTTAKLWDSATGRELLTLGGHRGPVRAVAWSPDGKYLATASVDNTAKVWDARNGQELLTLRGHRDPVASVAWSPDGTRMATAAGNENSAESVDNTAKVWDSRNGQEVLTLRGHEYAILSIGWSPDGNRLATGSQDGTSKVWDANTGRDLVTLRGTLNAIYGIAWSPNGNRLATASIAKTTKVWDAASGQELLALHGTDDQVLCVAWSPDGKRLVSGGSNKAAQVFAIEEAELLRLVRSRITRPLAEDECRRYFENGACPPLPIAP